MTKKDNLNLVQKEDQNLAKKYGLTLVQTSGGMGTRLRPLNLDSPTSMMPKGLVRVMGLPIAESQIRQIQKSGIKEVFVITQYLENRVQLSNRFGGGKRLDIGISYSDPSDDGLNIGSGDAILRNIEKKGLKGTSIVLSNDNLYEFDLEGVLRKHKDSGAIVSVMDVSVNPRTTIKTYGLIKSDLKNKILGLYEKPENEEQVMKMLGLRNSSELDSIRDVSINTAGYIVDNDALRKIMNDSWVVNGRKKRFIIDKNGKKKLVPFDMAGDLIKGLIKHDYPIYKIGIDAWGDLGETDFFLDTFKDALGGKFPSILRVLESQGYEHDLSNNIWIHQDSLKRKGKYGKTLERRITSGDVQIGRNVFIGRDSDIENETRIRFSNIEKNSKICEGVELEGAYLSPYCEVESYATLKNCGLGLHVYVDSSEKDSTYINGGSIIGPQISIPKGTRLAQVKVFPGYEFQKEGETLSKVILKPTKEEVMNIVKRYS